MDDKEIVELFLCRKEAAITETHKKYGRYCFAIANRILGNREDSDECVNDTYVGAWNAIPPHQPKILQTFLGKITRRLSVKKLRARCAEKRGGGEAMAALDELAECIPSADNIESEVQANELTRAINDFLGVLPDAERRIFVCRYWYCDRIKDISRSFGFSQSKVKMTLKRTREKLLAHLRKEELF